MPDDAFTKADLDKAVKDAVDEATKGLKQNLSDALDEAKEAKRKLRAASEIKPEDLTAAEDRADKAEKALADANRQVTTLTKERDAAVNGLETESAFTQKLLIQDGLKSALIANGVKDEDFIDSLAAKFGGGASVKVEGDVRLAMIGDKPLADAIKEWAGTDAGKKFIAAPVNSGGGASGGRSGNGSAKTMTRTAFDALDPLGKMAFSKDGGQLTES